MLQLLITWERGGQLGLLVFNVTSTHLGQSSCSSAYMLMLTIKSFATDCLWNRMRLRSVRIMNGKTMHTLQKHEYLEQINKHKLAINKRTFNWNYDKVPYVAMWGYSYARMVFLGVQQAKYNAIVTRFLLAFALLVTFAPLRLSSKNPRPVVC